MSSVGCSVFSLFHADCSPPAFPWLDPTCHNDSSARRSPCQLKSSLTIQSIIISNAPLSPLIGLHHFSWFCFFIIFIIICNHFSSCVCWLIFSLLKPECKLREKRGLVCLLCPFQLKPTTLPA